MLNIGRKCKRPLEIVGLSWLRRTANQSTVWRSIPASLDCQMFSAGSRLYPLDEPFVGIDSVSEEIIMNTLRDLKKAGKTVLIVHHDLSKVPTTSIKSCLSIEKWFPLVQPKKPLPKPISKKLTVIDSFSMEVTYDCRIYRWIAKFHFLQNALITAIVVGVVCWSCRMFHHPTRDVTHGRCHFTCCLYQV